jgi:hypothetical protein
MSVPRHPPRPDQPYPHLAHNYSACPDKVFNHEWTRMNTNAFGFVCIRGYNPFLAAAGLAMADRGFCILVGVMG